MSREAGGRERKEHGEEVHQTVCHAEVSNLKLSEENLVSGDA